MNINSLIESLSETEETHCLKIHMETRHKGII